MLRSFSLKIILYNNLVDVWLIFCRVAAYDYYIAVVEWERKQKASKKNWLQEGRLNCKWIGGGLLLLLCGT